MSEAHKEAKKKRATAKQKYHRIYNRMMQGLNGGDDEDVLKQILSDLERSYKEIEESNELLIETIDPPEDDDNDALIEKFENEMNTMYNELCEGRKVIVDIRTREERDKELLAMEKERKARINKDVNVSAVKIKPLLVPNVSGNIREYPSRDLQKNMRRI